MWLPVRPKWINFFQLICHTTFIVSCQGSCSAESTFWKFCNCKINTWPILTNLRFFMCFRCLLKDFQDSTLWFYSGGTLSYLSLYLTRLSIVFFCRYNQYLKISKYAEYGPFINSIENCTMKALLKCRNHPSNLPIHERKKQTKIRLKIHRKKF